MNQRFAFRILAVVLFASPLVDGAVGHAETVVISTNQFHLGIPGAPEWDEFAGSDPDGRELHLTFPAQENAGEQTFFIRQLDVKHDWPVLLNNRKIGTLLLGEPEAIQTLRIPARTLVNGTNRLSILPPKETDDIVVSQIEIDSRPLPQAVTEARLSIIVTDAETGTGIPSRISIADPHGALAPVHALPGQPRLAIRTGAVYTTDGRAELGVRAGTYRVYAGRGFEYSVGIHEVALARGESKSVRLTIRREVPTPGMVACDTHTHSLTFSGHGDATVQERVVALAGEGIELGIATEHNRPVDYTGPSKAMNVDRYFTPVTGIEVTTRRGHFNVFPVLSNSPAPDHQIEHWPSLMTAIRNTPNVQVIILNHPRDVHSGFRPFAATNFNPVTGQNLRGFEFEFHALELINSGALRSDLMQLYRDWFALLNHGHRIAGVGASDSHDLNRFIVGQGRTYVAAKDDQPERIDVDEACRSFREGRTSASMGLLTTIQVNSRSGPGDVASVSGDDYQVDVRVLGPSWTRADRVELFANGVLIRQEIIDAADANGPEKGRFIWKLPKPVHDLFLVAVASGPGNTSPFWPIPKPYQASSRSWSPRVIGSTGVVWVDADGDGQFQSARTYARRLIEQHGTEPAKLLPGLAPYDEAIAAQVASFCDAAGISINHPAFVRQLRESTLPIRKGFAAFQETLANLEIITRP